MTELMTKISLKDYMATNVLIGTVQAFEHTTKIDHDGEKGRFVPEAMIALLLEKNEKLRSLADSRDGNTFETGEKAEPVQEAVQEKDLHPIFRDLAEAINRYATKWQSEALDSPRTYSDVIYYGLKEALAEPVMKGLKEKLIGEPKAAEGNVANFSNLVAHEIYTTDDIPYYINGEKVWPKVAVGTDTSNPKIGEMIIKIDGIIDAYNDHVGHQNSIADLHRIVHEYLGKSVDTPTPLSEAERNAQEDYKDLKSIVGTEDGPTASLQEVREKTLSRLVPLSEEKIEEIANTLYYRGGGLKDFQKRCRVLLQGIGTTPPQPKAVNDTDVDSLLDKFEKEYCEDTTTENYVKYLHIRKEDMQKFISDCVPPSPKDTPRRNEVIDECKNHLDKYINYMGERRRCSAGEMIEWCKGNLEQLKTNQ